jgi:hypothetical protein
MYNISVFYIVNLQKRNQIQVFLPNSLKEQKRLIFSKTNYSNQQCLKFYN